MLKCRICGKEATSITHHIINAHKETTVFKYYDMYIKKPDEGSCKACGKPTKIVKFSKGYRDYCSVKCSTSSKEVQQKAKETYKERTGYDHTRHNPEAEAKLKATNLEKYGKEYFFATEESKDKIKSTNQERYGRDYFNNPEQTKQTNLEKYGVENVFANEDIKANIFKTNLEKFGYGYPMKNSEVVARMKATCKLIQPEITRKQMLSRKLNRNDRYKRFFEKYNYTYIDILDQSNFLFICDKGHDGKVSRGTVRNRLRTNSPLCNVCNPFLSGSSKPEKELQDFIRENYQGTIIENTKRVINPLELDIYLPDLKLAFEFNGLWWHCELNKPDSYHLDKTNECEKLGIHLVHIYEDDWNYHKDVVQSRILNMLNKSSKIFARDCEVREVNHGDSKRFLEVNHIQEFTNSTDNIGLYYKNELVSLMTFGGGRFKNVDSVELLRFCNKNYTSVVGGASRLFKAYLKKVPVGTRIISYADRSWSTGGLYKQLGFNHIKTTESNYHYIVEGIRENRFKYRKSELVKKGFEASKTEHAIMLEREIYRIYDCGSLKFEFIKP